MNTLNTLRFRLVPDGDFPEFRRLAWDTAAVSVRDVLLNGIHPWSECHDGRDVHYTLLDAFLERLNEDAAKPGELAPFAYCPAVFAQRGPYPGRSSWFEQTLEYIRREVFFVNDLTYLRLVEIARRRLRERWDHALAREMATRACPGFRELRGFLKARDKSVRLSGYGDLDSLDLGRVLSPDDFANRENLVISQALPSLNFRKSSALDLVTDRRGFLRLVPGIDRVSLSMVSGSPVPVQLVWHVEVRGEVCRFRPDIGAGTARRRVAAAFAGRWRTGGGRLCFDTGLPQLEEMIGTGIVTPTFPELSYTHARSGPDATATVADSHVPAYCLGGYFGHRSNGETLRDVLREHGAPVTGNKEDLLARMARVAAAEYDAFLPEMEAFFRKNRFVRIAATPPSERIVLPGTPPPMHNLLVTMYVVRHLRGGAVLDPDRDNPAFSGEQLALALLLGRTAFTGSLLRVV